MIVTIDLDNVYATALSFTAIGIDKANDSTSVTVVCLDLAKGNKIKVDENGEYTQLKEDD